MSTLASTFAELHVPGRPFVLVNAWDVASALLFADAGHPAVATTSAGVNAVAGRVDATREGKDPTIALVRLLSGRLQVPLSVDAEDGYADEPAEIGDFVAALGEMGVAGVNLEDMGRTRDRHAAVVAAVKERAPDVFCNARTDAFWSGSRDLDDALARLSAYRDAGADGLFAPGLTDPVGIERVVALGPPVNLLWQPGSPDLAPLGVARISTGSAPYRYALAAAARAADAARAGEMPPGTALPYPQLQRLLVEAPTGSAARANE